MGTDMKGYLEYRLEYEGRTFWQSVDHGWFLPRDYDMFALLANVRGEGALFPPRGVPRDVGFHVLQRYGRRVYYGAPDAPERPRGTYTRAEADALVASGEGVLYEYRSKYYVEHYIGDPTLSASWLTTDEFRQVVAYYDVHGREFIERDLASCLARPDAGEPHRQQVHAELEAALHQTDFVAIEWRMLLAAMEAGEARGRPVRLIFWFL